MALTSGTRLGTYTVTSLIGAGGMGEVYQARDSTLERDVAIKVLPEKFARDSERLARFQREAKMLASLNHPNIAAIYGFEQSGGMHYLVMEMVPGQTLQERVAGGRAVPLAESLEIAKQIAEALEAAHNSEKGIIHRDLKPANVKVTAEGKVKVLDFGLAKAFSLEASAENFGNSPTLSALPTMKGVIMGTAAYMAPEQARGKVVTKAADVWSFGCVLYELLTGKQAFHGEDVTDILAAVVRAEPDWSRLPADTPPAIRTLLKRCLRKDKRQRLQDAGSVRVEIEDVLSGATGAESTAAPAPIGRLAFPGRRALLMAAVCSLAVGIVAAIAVWNLKPAPAPPAQPVSRLVVPLPPDEQLKGTDGTMLALSADGTQLAYVAGSSQRIYLRVFDTSEAKALTGTEGANSPFFSPDGQWIGFFAGGKLKKVSVSGGAVLTLCDAQIPHGGAWGANDTIVFGATVSASLSQVSAAGGAPQPLTKLKEGETSHRWPQFLPDGKTILYVSGLAGANLNDAQIAAYRLDTGEQKILIRSGTYARYVPTGHLVYYQDGTIMAVPFDVGRLEVQGTPAPAIEGVMSSSGTTGGAQFSFSRLGSLVYVPGGPQAGAELTLVWVDRKGTEQPLPAPPHSYRNPRLSPDGRQVALDITEAGKSDIWIYDLLRDTLTRLTFEGVNAFPDWTPDGKRVAYRSQRTGPPNIYWKAADGSGAEERLTTSEFQQTPTSFSPDGRTLAYNELSNKTSYDLWVLPLERERKPQPFLQTPFSERAPRLSPDGRWLAYVSDESGRYEVYVRPFPGPGGKWQISTEGGTEVSWSPKGNELFYRTGQQREKMMVVEVQTQPSFSADKPRQLFEGPYVSNAATGPLTANYSIAPDGQRFLMLKPNEQQQSEALMQINVVQNWFEELKRRVPAGKQ